MINSSHATLWHRRLAHIICKDLKSIHKHGPGVPKSRIVSGTCHACKMGKAHKHLFYGRFSVAKKVGNKTHSDVMGSFELSFPDGFRYFVTSLDDHSRYTFVGMFRKRIDLTDAFKWFLKRISVICSARLKSPKGCEHQHHSVNSYSCIRRPHSNNAMEYVHLGKAFNGIFEYPFWTTVYA